MLEKMGWDGDWSLKAINDSGENALVVAISNQLPEVEEMIEKGSDVNIKDNLGWTPLIHLALTHSFTDAEQSQNVLSIIKKMVSRGADMNHKDNEGNPVIFYAFDNPVIFSHFLECGANPFLPNDKGDTCLMKALDDKNHEILSILRPYVDKENLEEFIPNAVYQKTNKRL